MADSRTIEFPRPLKNPSARCGQRFGGTFYVGARFFVDLSRLREGHAHTEAHSKEPPMAKDKTLETLFHDTLKDIYYAEKKILKTLPKMARAAQSPELKAAFEKHRDETEGHVEGLQQVFELMGKRAQGKTCEAIEGIVSEGEEIIDNFKGMLAIDAGLISAAQAVEHYEITRYGTLKRWAESLGMPEAAKLLGQTLAEESKTDEALTGLADSFANEMAKAA